MILKWFTKLIHFLYFILFLNFNVAHLAEKKYNSIFTLSALVPSTTSTPTLNDFFNVNIAIAIQLMENGGN